MKISIVIATFNSSATLKDTLESILMQDYSDYEVLVQDGGSTDGTLDIVDDYKSRFGERLILESMKDAGLYDGFNKGLHRASGDVVGFLNSDDFFTSGNVLSSIVKAYSDNPELDAVYADVQYVSATDKTQVVRFYCSCKFNPSRMRCGYMPAHPTFYARRECYERYGNFDLSMVLAADFEHVLRLIFINHIKTQYIHATWVTMRLGGASTSGLKSHWQIMQDHYHAYKMHGIKVNTFGYLCRYVEKITEYVFVDRIIRKVESYISKNKK